jgi:hypothetical protein
MIKGLVVQSLPKGISISDGGFLAIKIISKNIEIRAGTLRI